MPGRSLREFGRMKEAGEPITMLTAYDAPTARLVDQEDVDVVLVGDSVGNTKLGYDSTLPVSMEESLSHTAAVARAVEETFVVGDMPFRSYGASVAEGVDSAGRFLKEAGADAVKLETPPGGELTVDLADRLTELGIPVQGHVGLTPQHVNQFGGHHVQGKQGPESELADALVDTARRLEAAGVFTLIVEATTEGVARRITEAVDVPTIGIGAGRHVDGQVLVINDVLGFGSDGEMTMVKQYADLDSVISEAVAEYAEDVRSGEFPADEHVFRATEDDGDDD